MHKMFEKNYIFIFYHENLSRYKSIVCLLSSFTGALEKKYLYCMRNISIRMLSQSCFLMYPYKGLWLILHKNAKKETILYLTEIYILKIHFRMIQIWFKICIFICENVHCDYICKFKEYFTSIEDWYKNVITQ